MGGNKILKKFKESKIPKKGEGITNESVPIYAEPNTYSKIIGSFVKGQKFNWISKSVCQDLEWIRLGEKDSFGYMIGINKDGKYNVDTESIIEKKGEKKKEEIKEDPIKLTKKEAKIVNDIYNDFREELGFKPIELKNFAIEDNSSDVTNDTTTEESPIIYGLDDLNEDEKDNYLNDVFNCPDIFKIEKIKDENKKLVQEIVKNFDKLDNNESKKEIINDALSLVTQMKQEDKIISNIPDNFFSICKNWCHFLTLSTVKISSYTFIKFVWTEYHSKNIDIKEARDIVCRINSNFLSSKTFISKVYNVFGLYTTSIDCLKKCIEIENNANYSEEIKCKEIIKKIEGAIAGEIATRELAKSQKYKIIKKTLKSKFKKVRKFWKLGSKTNLITTVAGFALDIIVTYYFGIKIDELYEMLFDKVYDVMFNLIYSLE